MAEGDRRRTVLITGCSSGFGLSAAVAAAARNWRVFATMRDLDRRRRLDEAAHRAGVRVEAVELDVCEDASVKRAVSEVLEATGGRLDAVVNNAGIGDAGFFEDMPDDQVRLVMETNFFGTLAVTRAALPSLRASRGRVIVVSSIAAFSAQAGLSAYVASKRAVEGWAESMAVELRPFGVDVVLVEPGAYRTAIWEKSAVAAVPASPYAPLRERMEPRFRAMIDRMARDPQEVGTRIARLLDRRSPPFRNPVGPDSHFTRLLGRTVPISLRFRLLRAMAGLPGTAASTSTESANGGPIDGS